MSVDHFNFAKYMERQDAPFEALIMAAMVQATEVEDWNKLRAAWPEIAQECKRHEAAWRRQMEDD